jgi:hypothetical protein
MAVRAADVKYQRMLSKRVANQGESGMTPVAPQRTSMKLLPEYYD